MNARKKLSALVLVAGAVIVGDACPDGNLSAPIDLSKYDRTCATDDDCVEAFSDA